jgi:hypothetical protein
VNELEQIISIRLPPNPVVHDVTIGDDPMTIGDRDTLDPLGG